MSSEYKNTITITFGDQAENHKGMQKIGELATNGFTYDELQKIKTKFEEQKYICELFKLEDLIPEEKVDSASILIIRSGVNKLLEKLNKNSDDLYNEQNSLEPDKKALMYGRVVNKNARHNLCFADFSQNSDYQKGMGKIINFKDVVLTDHIREMLPIWLNEKADKLYAEGNYYYDINKCYIGWHGDSERKKVVAIRLGASFPLEYQWYYRSKPVGNRLKLTINHGDIYIMSEKATGFDWKCRSKYTLRHAAGLEKNIKIKENKNKKQSNNNIFTKKIIK